MKNLSKENQVLIYNYLLDEERELKAEGLIPTLEEVITRLEVTLDGQMMAKTIN